MSESISGIKINYTYFKEVADGSPEAYTDLLKLILTQQAEGFVTLNTTCQNNDFKLLEVTAHRMRAIVAVMGLTEQQEQLSELEEAAQIQAPQSYLAKRIEELQQMWQATAQELQLELTLVSGK